MITREELKSLLDWLPRFEVSVSQRTIQFDIEEPKELVELFHTLTNDSQYIISHLWLSNTIVNSPEVRLLMSDVRAVYDTIIEYEIRAHGTSIT